MDSRLIYLLRHGEVQSVGGRHFIGQVDLPLSTNGLKQADILGHEFSRARLSGIYCSDLERSRMTALAIAGKHRKDPVAVPALREISLGHWEGRTFEEIKRKYPLEFRQRGLDIANYKPPEGESFYDCSRRAVAAFNDIVGQTTGNILLVGHAGVNRVILCHLLGMPLENLFRIAQDYACVNIIQQKDNVFQVKLVNKAYKKLS